MKQKTCKYYPEFNELILGFTRCLLVSTTKTVIFGLVSAKLSWTDSHALKILKLYEEILLRLGFSWWGNLTSYCRSRA